MNPSEQSFLERAVVQLLFVSGRELADATWTGMWRVAGSRFSWSRTASPE